MNKTIKETWREEFRRRINSDNYKRVLGEYGYRDIEDGQDTLLDVTTYPESEFEIEAEKVEDFIESLISQVEALVRREVLDEVDKEVGKLYKPYEGEEQIMIEHHILDEVSTIINNLRPTKEIEEKV